MTKLRTQRQRLGSGDGSPAAPSSQFRSPAWLPSITALLDCGSSLYISVSPRGLWAPWGQGLRWGSGSGARMPKGEPSHEQCDLRYITEPLWTSASEGTVSLGVSTQKRTLNDQCLPTMSMQNTLAVCFFQSLASCLTFSVRFVEWTNKQSISFLGRKTAFFLASLPAPSTVID